MIVDINRFRELSRRTQAGLAAVLITVTAVVPVLIPSTVLAAPALLERELRSTSAVPLSTTDLTWQFDTTSAVADVDYIEIQFCDQPLVTCTTNNTPAIAASPTATLTNFTSNTVDTTTRESGLGGGTDNQIQIDKTTTDSGTSLDEATISLAPTDITNDSAANTTYYTRMRLYSDTGTTLVWEGVFAQSTSQTLTVNARVQERLDFCVGSTAVNDATTTTGAACANITGDTVDIGNIENGNTNVSPVLATNGGSNTNGVAMIRTNAVNGASVSYRSLLETSSGALKVPGATCVDTSPFPTGTSTDQCFNSANDTVLVAGEEEFGMTIAGINCGSTTAYSCVFSTGTYNLQRDAKYDGNDTNTYVADTDQEAAATDGKYAWLDTGLADPIASSTANVGVKVIDDEAMILKFAATAGITTPTGAYSVQADYIATTTF